MFISFCTRVRRSWFSMQTSNLQLIIILVLCQAIVHFIICQFLIITQSISCPALKSFSNINRCQTPPRAASRRHTSVSRVSCGHTHVTLHSTETRRDTRPGGTPLTDCIVVACQLAKLTDSREIFLKVTFFLFFFLWIYQISLKLEHQSCQRLSCYVGRYWFVGARSI